MTDVYKLDPAHTTLGFTAKHLMVTTVRGRFKQFDGQVEVEGDDPTTAVATLTAQASSIDTGVDQRDDHLRSADFFESERYPELTYRSTKVEPLGGNRYRVIGELTIRDHTGPLELEAEVEESFQDPWGNRRVGVSATGKLKRTDWGLNWNQLLEAGRFAVSEQIKLEIETALVLQAEVAQTT